jgi:hypothetical protein
MTMVVHVAGRNQRRHITAAQGALLRQVQLGPSVLMADGIPPLVGLHPADGCDANPASMGVGVAHHSLRPVDEHEPRTSLGPDEPPIAWLGGGEIRDQRAEELLIGSQFRQEPPHLAHVKGRRGPQLVQASLEAAERARERAGSHHATLTFVIGA